MRTRALHLQALAALAAAALFLLAGGCKRDEPELPLRRDPRHAGRYVLQLGLMGTDATLMVAAPNAEAAQSYTAPAVAFIRRVEREMSTYQSDSEISTLNRWGAAREVKLSPDTLAVLREAKRFSELTGGAFDVTYAPLRTLWRQAQKQAGPPTEDEITQALRAVGSDKLVLTDTSARFAAQGMAVDLGGIAKGFAIEGAARAMAGAGAKSALVDVGGDMRVVGRREDAGKWCVEVRDPRPGEHEPMVLELEDVAVATSGDYARYFRVGEQKLSHIIDPRTGRPVANVPSATVVAPSATDADALSTAVSVLGAARALELVNSLEGVECMLMVRTEGPEGAGFELYYSDGFRALMAEGE